MEIWRGYKVSLEELKERKQGQLTLGQEESLTSLIDEMQTVELAGKPPSIKRMNRLAKGLLFGQHLEEPELVELIQFVNPARRR